MKSTGVIRRIDELGRIVIPKEIRRNLGIRDGENVEIFTDSDSIILKKYYRMSTSTDLANSLCELINSEFNYKIMITDREKVISESGFKEELINKSLPQEFINIIEEREVLEGNKTIVFENIEISGNFVFIPIISLNDSIGLVILYSEENLTNEASIGKLVASIFSKKLDI